jgi:hypothetical protein
MLIWFEDAAEKMGVDVMRLMYVKQNPVQRFKFWLYASQ